MVEHVRHTKTAQQLRLLSDALDSGRLGPVRRLVNILSPAEIGNLLESLPAAKRNIVWGLVDPEDDGEVLVHVGEDVREGLQGVRVRQGARGVRTTSARRRVDGVEERKRRTRSSARDARES